MTAKTHSDTYRRSYPSVRQNHFDMQLQKIEPLKSSQLSVKGILTIQRAHECVCIFFDIKKKEEEALFKSIFLSDFRFDSFELKQNNETIYRVIISDDRVNDLRTKSSCIENKNQRIAVTITNDVGRYRRTLTPERIEKQKVYDKDHVAIAFFNTKSFTGVTLCSISLNCTRHLEKLNFPNKL
jgi:hypothetical protein